MIEIGRTDVQRLVAEAGAQLVEVLPAKEFDDEHLPGAVNIPLAELASWPTAPARNSTPSAR